MKIKTYILCWFHLLRRGGEPFVEGVWMNSLGRLVPSNFLHFEKKKNETPNFINFCEHLFFFIN